MATLLAAASVAQANSGAITNVVATTEQLTFNVHLDWSECHAIGFGSASCGWGAMARYQEPDTECTDFSAGVRIWGSGTQSMPGAIDQAVTTPLIPGVRMTLCLWVYSYVSAQWAPVARASVDAPDLPPPPVEPHAWTAAEATSSALYFTQLASADARRISATCQPGLSAVCATSWTDATYGWHGTLTIGQDTATFAGEKASLACLKRHRRGCWHAAKLLWDPAKDPPVAPAS
jgi:hypothetical protein